MCCCWKNVENLIVFRHFYKVLKGKLKVLLGKFWKIVEKIFLFAQFFN
jgi:hypothetical protein